MPNLSYSSHDDLIAAWGPNLTLGLLSAAPNPDGTGIVEPDDAANYDRQPIVLTKQQADGITTLSNNASIAFGPATGADWVAVSYFGLFDAGDEMRLYGRLRTTRETDTGEGIIIPIGDIQIRLR